VAFTPRRPAAVARDLAQTELRAMLDSGETIESAAFASRREFWNYYHAAYGVLAATDRRMVWVGVAPRGLIEWGAAEEPPAFETRVWPYDSVSLAPARVMLGVWPGLQIDEPSTTMRFAVRARDSVKHQRIISLVARHQAELRARAERLRKEQELAAWRARQPLYHVVQAGEAVISIAERYGLAPDSLRAMNGLEGDRIYAGQKLLVRRGSEAGK
jgi:hypothetical protein